MGRGHARFIATIGLFAILLALGSVWPLCADGIAWHDTLDDALTAASKSDKLVMLSLYTPLCDACTKLREVTWPAELVVAKSAEFECIQQDPEGKPAYERYDNGIFPRILFLTAAGEIVHEVPGFIPPEPFVEQMDRAHEGARKLQQAIDLEKRAAESPDDLALAHRAAKLYLEVHFDHAKKAVALLGPLYEKIDALDEGQRSEVAFDYGVALLADRQYGKAKGVIGETLDKYDDPTLAHRAGKLYLESGFPDLAAAVLGPLYEKVEELDEQLRAEVPFDYGIALVLLDELEQAVTVLRAAAEKHPDHRRTPQGRFALGLALANLDKLAEAREQWEKVVESDPEGPFAERARNFIEQVNQQLGDR